MHDTSDVNASLPCMTVQWVALACYLLRVVISPVVQPSAVPYMWPCRQRTARADFVESSRFWSQSAILTYQNWLGASLQVLN